MRGTGKTIRICKNSRPRSAAFRPAPSREAVGPTRLAKPNDHEKPRSFHCTLNMRRRAGGLFNRPLRRRSQTPQHPLLCSQTSGGASATGYAGDPNVKTPNLDRLRREGLNFAMPFRAARLHPASRGATDRALPTSTACSSTTRIFQTASCAWRRFSVRRATLPPTLASGTSMAADASLISRRSADRVGTTGKAAECDHNYNHSHYFTGNSEREAVLGRL